MKLKENQNITILKVKVATQTIDYTKDELQEMLDKYEMYKQADNLVKWLYIAGKINNISKFPKTEKQIKDVIQRIIDVDSPNSYINVSSTERRNNIIKIG